MTITQCPNCKMRVLPNPDGTCPSCQSMISPQDEAIAPESPSNNIQRLTVCPSCGGSITGSESTCPFCGMHIDHPSEEIPDPNISGFADQPQPDQPELAAEPLLDTFNVTEIKGFKKRPTWTVTLFTSQAEFFCPETGARIIIPRADANTLILFPQGGFFSEGTTAVVSGVSFEFSTNKARLLKWMPLKNSEVLKKDLKGWGISLLAIGVLSLIFSSFLDPIWGVVLIVLGIVNLLIRHRAMFIVNGLALIFIGVLNVLSIIGAASGFNFWLMFGVFQVVWGVQEIKKYKRYAPTGGSEPGDGNKQV
jgi:hypothetical protein